MYISRLILVSLFHLFDIEVLSSPFQVCFLPGTLALGATKGLTKEKAMKGNLLKFEDIENLKLAEDLAKTCFEKYSVTSTGLAPEIAYFNLEVTEICIIDFLESMFNNPITDINLHRLHFYNYGGELSSQ